MKKNEQNSNLIEQKWEEECVPLISGFVFPTGEILWVDIYCNEDNNFIYEKGEASKLNIEDLISKEDFYWIYVTELKRREYKDENIIVSCGEGSYGGDGFVEVRSYLENKLLWIAFFDNSNPFVEVKVEERKIIATNNQGCDWVFSVDDPNEFYIITRKMP